MESQKKLNRKSFKSREEKLLDCLVSNKISKAYLLGLLRKDIADISERILDSDFRKELDPKHWNKLKKIFDSE